MRKNKEIERFRDFVKTGAALRPEDRILWETVARTARPLARSLSGRMAGSDELPDFAVLMREEEARQKAKAAPPAAGTPDKTKKPPASAEMPIHPFDRPTHRRIAKGRVDIEARIDLHGLTQNEAHGLLYGFLSDAHARGLRHVMVITGKGRSFGSEGILRQAVPHWFSTPLFRLLVSAYDDAARHHGGHGALYVRLRRRTQTDFGTGRP
ncbi:MAG: Smr/MutS family protein [Rhizobiales bacterium]|nr:Smr/MutS family protein [Hyphomicrobiales bacterium]OJY07229.1 MAG: DNA mismatch repair protein MutS [Rhizobiales bacterium 63-22]